MNKKTLIGSIVVVAVVAACANADLVQADYQGVKKGTGNIVLPGYNDDAYAGLILFQKLNGGLPLPDNSEFISFCIELNDDVSENNNPITFDIVDPQYASNTLPMGPTRANMLSAWFGQYWQGAALSDWTQLQAVAFQLGVWEIIYEDMNNIGNLSNGSLYVANSSGSTALNARTQTNDWFSLFDPSGPSQQISALTKRCIQDQVTVTPEPLTIGLLAIGGAAILKRRKSNT